MPNKSKTYPFQSLLNDFQAVSLKELDTVRLLDRKDTKFVFNQIHLPLILEKVKPFYKILEINNDRVFTYDTIYFDTDDFLFYNQHHNGEKKRFKIRSRTYSSTNQSFFEIKIKNNKDRTVKKRLLVDDMIHALGEKEKKLVSEIIGPSSNQYSPKLNIEFSRITLTDNNFTERLTIDTDLSVKNGTDRKIFSQLVISEIKQNKYNPKSNFIQILRDLKIQDMRFSKYCFGVMHLNDNVKYNRFKPRLLQINKILAQTLKR